MDLKRDEQRVSLKKIQIQLIAPVAFLFISFHSVIIILALSALMFLFCFSFSIV